MPNRKSLRTKTCAHCGQSFLINLTVNGVRKNFRKRKYCFECVPFGSGGAKALANKNATSRVCTTCGEEKPLSEFYKRSRGGCKADCKACHDKYGLRQRHLYKKQAVLHKGGKCQHCGYDRFQGALEFHHVNPGEKDFNFSGVLRSFESSKAELDKCVLVCVNCHREEHVRLLPSVPVGVLDPKGPQCVRCGLHKAAGEFKQRGDGRGRHPWCNACQTEYQRARRLQIKQETVDYKGGCCQMCSYDKCLDALEFHHLDPTQKDLGVAELRKRLATIKSEVDKCLLICGNCHRELHHALELVVF